MKTLATLLFVLLLLSISCYTNKTNPSDTMALGDTIQTDSGLQYFYLKKGDGRKIESGATVSTYLSLQVNDSVV